MTNSRIVTAVAPDYWEQACQELMQRDRVLKKLIPATGKNYLTCKGDPFQTLVRTVIGQQISVKAAKTIWQRFLTLCPACSPIQVLEANADNLSKNGLSKRKTEYLQDLAIHFLERKIQVDKWEEMSDEEIIEDLTQIRGIGRWTAEMFLIFNLLRPNVFPVDDVGLQKGISHAYFSDEPVSRSDIREIAANWEPWRTVATWYLWRSLTPLPVEY